MKIFYQAFMLLIVTTLMFGILYPLLVTGIGQLAFSHQSNGSLVKRGDEIIGSELIAQPFLKPEYFWPRPSACNYNAVPSGASNLGPTSALLAEHIAQRRRDVAQANNNNDLEIPMDLLTTSASGLDPHISLEAAKIQLPRIAAARALNASGRAKLEHLLNEHLEARQLGILGQSRLNVLMLNMALDKL